MSQLPIPPRAAEVRFAEHWPTHRHKARLRVARRTLRRQQREERLQYAVATGYDDRTSAA